MNLFDTHMHLPDEPADPEGIIWKAVEAGVTRMLACGGSITDCEEVRQFAQLSSGTWFAAGICPQEADHFSEGSDFFKRFAEDSKFAAIGEIGLDTYYNADTFSRQIEVFRQMLKLALDYDVPAVIHCRSAENSEETYQICYDILRDFYKNGGRFVLHCYTGSIEYMKKFADIGAYFGAGGMITFKKADNVRSVVTEMPIDRLLLETDSPYLAPVPHRGEPNTPAFIPLIAQKMAEIRALPLEEIAKKTTANALQLFNRIR